LGNAFALGKKQKCEGICSFLLVKDTLSQDIRL
jgi:hypothetical protein